MSNVFISYSSQDITFARHLKRLLEEKQLQVWIDESRLTTSKRWWPTIERAIEAAPAVIVIMSPASRRSDWVEREVLYAEKLRKPIFPVLLAGDEWPRLANIHYADMRKGLKARLPRAFFHGLRAVCLPVTGVPTVPANWMLVSRVHRTRTIVRRRPLGRANRLRMWLAVGGLVVALLLGVVLKGSTGQSLVGSADDSAGARPEPSPTPVVTLGAQVVAAVIAEPTATPQPAANMRLVYDDDAVLLINESGSTCDASQLVFEQALDDGRTLRWQASEWERADVLAPVSAMSAGGCYQLVRYGGAQITPLHSRCMPFLGWFRSAHEARYFWLSDEPGAVFYVRRQGAPAPLAVCEIAAGDCAFYLPD